MQLCMPVSTSITRYVPTIHDHYLFTESSINALIEFPLHWVIATTHSRSSLAASGAPRCRQVLKFDMKNNEIQIHEKHIIININIIIINIIVIIIIIISSSSILIIIIIIVIVIIIIVVVVCLLVLLSLLL